MRYIFVISVVALACAPCAMAEEVITLSLQNALLTAYEKSPRLVTARQETEAAKGRWIQARAYPNPELEISSSEISEGLRGGSTVGEDSIAISQEFDLLGKVGLHSKAKKAEYEAAQHMLRQTWNDVASEVIQSYNQLLFSRQRAGVVKETLELTRRFLDQVQLRYNAGEVLRNELLRSQIEVAKAENDVLEADKQVKLDTATLNVLLGRDARTETVPSDELSYEPRDFDADKLLAQALVRRPDLKASTAHLEAQRKRLKLATRDIFGNPTVSATGTREGGERVFGLAFNIPIPIWNWNRGAVREAKAELAKHEVKHGALQQQVGLEVATAIEEASLAQRQASVWRSAVDQANELIRIANLQYREGDLDFVTYLEHLATVRETKLNYIESLTNYRSQLALLDQAVADTLVPSGFEEEE